MIVILEKVPLFVVSCRTGIFGGFFLLNFTVLHSFDDTVHFKSDSVISYSISCHILGIVSNI